MDGTPTKPENEMQNVRSVVNQENTPPHPRTFNLPAKFQAREAMEEDELPGIGCLLTEDQTAKDKAQMIVECFGYEEARDLVLALWAEVKEADA